MTKFVELSVSGNSQVKSVLINIDQIVAVEKFDRIYRIITTSIKPGAHGSMALSFDVSADEFEEKVRPAIEALNRTSFTECHA